MSPAWRQAEVHNRRHHTGQAIIGATMTRCSQSDGTRAQIPILGASTRRNLHVNFKTTSLGCKCAH
eukprot:scaffold145898_cov17-Prasinocladus_malaysianus.AAC.1